MPGSQRFEPGVLSLSEGHMAYHRVGAGARTIVLLHGLGDNGLCWQRTAQALADEFTVIMLDSRGHGGSSMPPADSRDNPAQDIGEVLDLLGVDRAYVLGHSVGALAACQFVAASHDRVIALALEDPPFRERSAPPSLEMVAAFGQQIEQYRQMDRQAVVAAGRTQHPGWDSTEFDAWAEGKQQVDPAILSRYDFPGWRDVVSQIRVPTLLMHGEPGSDSVVSVRKAQAITALNPCIRSVVIESAGHNIRRENFGQYLANVVKFFNNWAVP